MTSEAQELADRFGVSAVTIYTIRNGKVPQRKPGQSPIPTDITVGMADFKSRLLRHRATVLKTAPAHTLVETLLRAATGELNIPEMARL